MISQHLKIKVTGKQNMNLIKQMLSSQIFVNALIIFCSLFFSILLAEAALRLVGVTGEQKVDETVKTISDEKLGMRIIPNQDGVDGRGFNNLETLNEADIVTLGDSHTYGGHTSLGRENVSWPAQLAEMTDRTVYNMGVWGYGTAQYRELFETALSLQPEKIVVGMYIANDFFDNYDTVYHRKGWGEYQDANFIDSNPVTIAETKQIDVPFRSIRDWLNDKSVIYNLLGNNSRALREWLGISKPVVTGTNDWSVNDKDIPLNFEIEDQNTQFWTGHRLPGVDLTDERIKEGWRLSKVMYKEMSDMANREGVELVVLMIPSKMTAYRELVSKKDLNNQTFDEILTNETLIRLNMMNYCDDIGIICLDVAPSLSEALLDGVQIYKTDRDEHPLPVGYTIYASVVADNI